MLHSQFRSTSHTNGRLGRMARRLVVVPVAAVIGIAAAAVADVGEPVDTGGLGTLSGYYLAARHAGNNKDLDAAADYYRSALIGDPRNQELLDRTVLLLVASGDIDEAVTHADDLLESDGDNQVALLTLAVDAIARGESAAALQHLDGLTGNGPLQELTASLLKAWLTAGNAAASEAIAQIDSLEGPDWFDTFTTLHAGLIADFAGDSETAIERLMEAYDRDPTALRTVTGYARALARADRREEALDLLGTFEAGFGDESYTAVLREEIASGAPVAPLIDGARAGAAETLYLLGAAVGSQPSSGETFGASYLRLALHLTPDAPFPALELAGFLERMGQNEAAIEIYRAIPADSVGHRKATIQTALNLNALDRTEEAIATIRPLIDADPTDIEAGVALGNIYRSRERFDEASEVYTTLIEALGEVPQQFWSLYYYRGITYEQTDRWPLAEADFLEALEMQPDDPLVLNYLGYSWIDRGENLDQAVSMVEKAVAQRPDDGYIVDSLGWAYYRLGNYDKAVKELEKAVELRPNDPTINDHLGDAYWKVGRKLEATFQWAHARDLEPKPAELKKILAKLEHGLDVAQAMFEAEKVAGDSAKTE